MIARQVRVVRNLGWVLTVAATALMVSFTGARAVSGAEVAGEPAVQGWIIVTGSAVGGGEAPIDNVAGIQIFTSDEFGPDFATPRDNPLTGASGEIVPAHEGFCDCTHYHGTIFGISDPDPDHCGWGCVVPIDDAPEALVDVSDALMSEGEAFLAGLEGDFESAVDHIEEAIDLLGSALDNVPENGDEDWDRKDGKKFKKAVKSAIRKDKEAVKHLTEALDLEPGPAQDRLITKAGKALEAASKAKRKATILLGKQLNLGEPEAR